jgi:UDP:flavonoid glycosyltransferase YjiC (YdhE family)
MIGVRAVFLIGRDPANRPTRLERDAIAVESVPHELLFPRASATVHHGGIGTTGQALRAGCPMLVVPFAHDQPDNAHRVRKLGVARVLYPGKYAASRIARELRQLLTTGAYTDRAEQVGVQIRAEHGGEAACEAIVAAAMG